MTEEMRGTGERASFGLRLVAALIDGVLLGIASYVLMALFDAAGSLLQIVLGLAYYIWLEGSETGQTLGKRAVSIRVVGVDGRPIGYGNATARYFGRIVSAIPLLLGYLWMLWDRDSQTWHDKMARSLVVRA